MKDNTSPQKGFSFKSILGDAESLKALDNLNGQFRPRIHLSSRFFPFGVQASVVGFGVLPPEGSGKAPIITRMFAARIPSDTGPASIIRRNDHGVWVSIKTPLAEVTYKGQFPAKGCKPGEVFMKVVSTITKDQPAPIHTYQVWDSRLMQWSPDRIVSAGLVGILPINQGPCQEAQDRAAAIIHQAMLKVGFVVSSSFKNAFARDLPEGFPAMNDARLVQEGPVYVLESLQAWADDLTNSFPARDRSSLQSSLASFHTESQERLLELRQAADIRKRDRRMGKQATKEEVKEEAEEPAPEASDISVSAAASMGRVIEEEEPVSAS